jgi:DnaJ domain
MPCVCARCLEHSRTLGLTGKAPSKAAIRKAFKGAAKQWHPDRFENNPARRVEAEEHFKVLQVAYRELWEHIEAPELLPTPEHEHADAPPAPRPSVKADVPEIFFGSLPGCFTAPNFPGNVWLAIADQLQPAEQAVAFVDLSAGGSWEGNRSRFILLTSYRIIVRDVYNVISLLWYTDLGDVLFVDTQEGKTGFWQKMVQEIKGPGQRYTLEILRHNGARFFSIEGQTDDRVKRVIYNFLVEMKQQLQH